MRLLHSHGDSGYHLLSCALLGVDCRAREPARPVVGAVFPGDVPQGPDIQRAVYVIRRQVHAGKQLVQPLRDRRQVDAAPLDRRLSE